MISNTQLNNQTTVASMNADHESAIESQQATDLATPNAEILAQYQTAKENSSFEYHILSQRSYTKGYRGL